MYRVDVDLSLLYFVQDALGERGEELGDVDAGLGGGGVEGKLRLRRLRWGRFDEVQLVAHQHHLCPLVGVVVYLTQPRIYGLQTLRVAKVVDQDDPDRILVVGPRDGPEGFLTSLHIFLLTVSQI
jgi:hypothetical protein